VSSVVGAAPGGPGVAAYSATKAYEKSLALSLGKELERFGVGVTCIMPGAVKGTTFAAQSNMENAVCWKLPFYAMTAPSIASRSVRALLAGDAEIIPGWHNRSFLKIAAPMLPQRLTTLVVGFAFSPLKLPWATTSIDENETLFPGDAKIRNKRMPPRLLTLPKSKEEAVDDSFVQSRFPNTEEEEEPNDVLQSENVGLKDGAPNDELRPENVDEMNSMSDNKLQPEDVDGLNELQPEEVDVENDMELSEEDRSISSDNIPEQ